jgi:hypothetical protein
LSGRGLCDELITRPEETYRLGCIVVCDLEAMAHWGLLRLKKKKKKKMKKKKKKKKEKEKGKKRVTKITYTLTF